MKKRLFCLALLCAFAALLAVHATAANVTINATNFPDANFREYLSDNCDTNNDGTLSASEIGAVKDISAHDYEISDLKGVEYFTSLEELYCGYNYLTSLDLSKNTALRELYCQENPLLTSLDVSDHSALDVLDVSGSPKLETLSCNGCALTTLNVSGCPALKTLKCSNDQKVDRIIVSKDSFDCQA